MSTITYLVLAKSEMYFCFMTVFRWKLILKSHMRHNVAGENTCWIIKAYNCLSHSSQGTKSGLVLYFSQKATHFTKNIRNSCTFKSSTHAVLLNALLHAESLPKIWKCCSGFRLSWKQEAFTINWESWATEWKWTKVQWPESAFLMSHFILTLLHFLPESCYVFTHLLHKSSQKIFWSTEACQKQNKRRKQF